MGEHEGKDDGQPKFMRIKIISMGDAAVGKSCIIKRFCEQKVRWAGAARQRRGCGGADAA